MFDKADALLAVLFQYAPNAHAHQMCANLYSNVTMQVIRDYETKAGSAKEIEIAMASAILDGLKHGNWPWTPPPGVSANEGVHMDDLQKDTDGSSSHSPTWEPA